MPAIKPDTGDYEVFGFVIDADGRRMAGLDIRAFDRDVRRETVLGQASSDGAGAYRIVFPAALFRKTIAERGGPDLIVRAFDDTGLLLAQSAMVPAAGPRTELNLSLDSDLRLVSGIVRDDAGRALPNLRVRVFDRDLRSEELLGEALSDSGGRYQVRYTSAQFRRAEKAAADLRVHVFGADGKRALTVSDTLFNAAPRAVIDLTIPADALHTDSEWERYLRELGPLLGNLALHELNDDDLQFLAGETGIDAAHLPLLRLDALWREQQARHKLEPGALYGLLRQGLSTDWALLLQAGPSRWRAALKQAIAARQAPAALAQASEPFVAKLTELAVDQSFVPPPEGSGAAPPIGVLLAGSAVQPDVQRLIAGVMLTPPPDDNPEQVWQSLAQAGVPEDAVRSTRFALEAYGLVHRHLPTLATLQSSLGRGFGGGADLARLARPQWMAVAQAVAKSLPKGFASAEAYAEFLADEVERAFPTAVVAHRLVEDAHPVRSDVGLLLTRNPEFDLLTGSVDQFMSTANLEAINTPRQALTMQLATEARVARIAPASNRAMHMHTLQAQGFDSATKVAMAGDVAFKSRVGKIAGVAATNQMVSNAKLRAADLTIHALALGDYLAWPLPVLPSPTVAPESRLARWAEMFGSATACLCPPCVSVHGPGAYLMDILQYLKDMKARLDDESADAQSLYDRLILRRPDLQHLKLHCANAETPLPYIDLVNELLERRIGGVVADAVSTPQTPETIEGVNDVAALLRALPLDDPNFAYLYAADGAMQTARYPWNMPFDRGFLQASMYFGLIGTTPAEVLALTVAPGDALQRAQLGLNPANWTLLQDARLDDVAASWGLSSLDSLLRFGTGAGLLARSALPVAELFALIESPLFQGWSLHIDRLDDPCNIDAARLKQRIGETDAELGIDTQREVFALMHRVLRLRSALDWPMAKLQLVLQALQVGRERPAIDLVALARLITLAAQLGLSAEQLAARLLALDQGAPFARDAWLAAMNISDADHGHLGAVGLADSLAPQAPAERLLQLENALRSIGLLRAAGIAPAELRYLLLDVDLVPAVFMPRSGELEAQLTQVTEAIRRATADMAGGASADDILARRRAAVVERLAQFTDASFVANVIDQAAPAVALLTGALEHFIVHATAPTAASAAAAEETLLRVLKTCRLLSLLRFTQADVQALGRMKGAGNPLFDFDAIPAAGGGIAAGPTELEPLVWASVTQGALPAADRRLLQVVADAADAAAACTDFDTITGTGPSITLAHTLGLAASDPATWRSPETYARLLAATRWLQQRRLTLAPENTLATLLRGAGGEPGSLEPLQALARSRFAADADWYKALAPAMDRLRVQRRDALLARLLYPATGAGVSADQVYAELLIDVQMGPCQLSSRLVQAHAAVQLFVQRCLMNLEEPEHIALGNVSDITQWQQWEWMKNYRVWEAGRKVFLYPENWIEPDLRDVKSPFFEELENALLQDEISPDVAEQAVRAYLTKLHDVARLDIRALFEERFDERRGDGTTVARTLMHMVGRTRATPHLYFYRQRLDDLNWTPWEKIELGIDADHLVLAVHNRRPMLFWPQFKEVQLDRNDPPNTALDMALSWSVREFGQWAPPKKTAETVRVAVDDRANVTLRPDISASSVALYVYRFLTLGRPAAPLALGFLYSDDAFSMDACSGELTLQASTARRFLLLPRAVVTHEQALRENAWRRPSITYLRSEGIGYDETLANLLLDGALGPAVFLRETEGFTITPCHQYARMTFGQPYVFTHAGRPLYAFRKEPSSWARKRYVLESGDHPYLCDLLEAVRADGLAGLYRPAEVLRRVSLVRFDIAAAQPGRHPRQLTSETGNRVLSDLQPNSWHVAQPYPVDEFDFSTRGAYGLYNWEVFFHIPLLLADRLSKNQRFEDAHKWFHTIFDPTDVSPHPAPQKYWRVKPLFGEAQRWSGAGAIETLEAMMRRLAGGAADVEAQVAAWRNDPFNPHLIARMRLVAYMKTVVQKYIENLTAWADSLFRQDTMESINQATQLYVLGREILGAAPGVAPAMQRVARSYHELTARNSVDDFSNVLLDIETSLPLPVRPAGRVERGAPGVGMLYFCIPANARLQELRATIAERLFKIRHCMDIEGRTRQLALFAPPIDPALLVRARAAGLDIGTALSMALGTRPPHYRFQPLLQKALEYCAELRSFGNALLGALEKRDGEQLAQLRSRHEGGILKLVALVRKQQVAESEASLEAARRSRLVVQARLDFYADNLQRGESASEKAQIAHLHQAHGLEMASASHSALAAIFHALPVTVIGVPCSGVEWGGPNLGHATQAAGAVFGMLAQQWTFEASMSGYNATYERRAQEWRHQIASATRELAQIDQQIVAAEIRLAIAEQEQRNHEQQIAQSDEVQAALRDKFTNTQLYSWMSAQLAALHYQSFRMAFDLAKQAELAADRELGTGLGFVALDHWDGGKKGLLAGERLGQDLRALELAYMQRNTRQLEISSNISLRRLDPLALWNLRVGGRCAFAVPASLFEMDFPGHSGRRVKSVSVSVPGVVGPYGGVNGILMCTSERRIATSSGQNDAGVFQLDFRDERYLPFEGIDLDGGTHWDFVLPAELRQFDYDTISDVVLHIQYTVRDAGDIVATDPASIAVAPSRLLVSVRHDFPAESRLLQEGHAPAGLEVVLEERLFPYFARGHVRITDIVRLGGDAGSPPPAVVGTNSVRLMPADAQAYFAVEYGR